MTSSLFEILPLMLALAGLLLAVAAISARASSRLGIPSALMFIGLGMVIGRVGQFRDTIEEFDVAYSVGTTALAVILFYGGLSTNIRRSRGIWTPSILLATVGVLGVTLLTALCAKVLVPGFTWPAALILGAVLGSTDAASVLQILSGERIAGRVRETVELESGLNDPMAFILVAAFTAVYVGDGWTWTTIPAVAWQIVGGAAIGGVIGWFAIRALLAFREEAAEVYPARTLAVLLVAYGAASLVGASGLLAVFLAALCLANSRALPYRATVVRFHATLAYLAQIVMFLVLGFLVDPKELINGQVVIGGAALALALAAFARPLVVTCILWPCGYSAREIAGVAWLGLRGAVPIVLMTIPLISVSDDRANADLRLLFLVVFCCVIVGSFVPGSTVRWTMRLLRLRLPPVPRASAAIDLVTAEPLDASLLMFVVHPASPIAGRTLAEAKIPGEITVAMLVRGARTERVRGDTRFEVGDEVALSVPDRMVGVARRIFGEEEE
jgi:cell volume regulation protein A